MPRPTTIAAAATSAALAHGLGWFGYSSSRPGLTTVSEGFELCAPANADGEVMFGWDMFRNDSGRPVRIARFVPGQAAGVEVIGGHFLLDDEVGARGAQSDPEVVPSEWAFREVPPGSTATLVIGLRLTDPHRHGTLAGGTLAAAERGLLGAAEGESTTAYAVAPHGTVCE